MAYAVRPLPKVDDAVKLFLSTARRSGVKLRRDPSTTELLKAICSQRLQCIPLAIVLAAQRCGAIGLEDIYARRGATTYILPEPSERVTTGADNHVEYPSARRRRIERIRPPSRLREHFDLDAFCKVACRGIGADGGDLMNTLVRHSLVETQDDPTRAPHHYRYFLLNPIREVAEEILAANEEPEVRAWHADYYSDKIAILTRELAGSGQQHALQALDDDLDNIRVALEWAWSAEPQLVPTFAADLAWYWAISIALLGWLKVAAARAPSRT